MTVNQVGSLWYNGDMDNTVATHHFPSTDSAYARCQCDDSVRDGDVLVVAAERVVGIADTWPLAVTAEHGSLHRAALPPDGLDGLVRSVVDFHFVADPARALALAGRIRAGIAAAVADARRRGWPVAEAFASA